MDSIPTGTVTFLFTDIEGSTKLAQAHPAGWESARERHHAILHSASEAHQGHVFRVIGDAFCVAFQTASDGLQASIAAQRALQAEAWGDVPILVRMGLHTGTAEAVGGDYQGYLTLAQTQRVMSAAHGAQTLVSNATASLLRGQLPDGVTLRDMGEHRLKGLLNPENLWQVVAPDLPQEFPPLESPNTIPNNLPIQATPFIGRESDVTAIQHELLHPEVRLLTLTGVGGAGKTRLALQVSVGLLNEFSNGVWLVSLAPISDPALVVPTIAGALGVREAQGKPLLDTLKDFLHEKQLLLLLDNFEQVISTAPLVSALLNSTPRLKVLVTSRELLRIYGEHDYPVSPLSLPELQNLPPLEQLAQFDAVRLFIERATAVKPDFGLSPMNASAITEICYRLDGLPLAIELAAAQVRFWSPQKMLAQLDNRLRFLTSGPRDVPARQRTLRGMVDWSHELLSSSEKVLFRRLAVFVGGCTLEAIESVCNLDGQQAVLGEVQSLVDKNLLVRTEFHGESRFSTLESIREYAHERLTSAGELETMQDRHLSFYLGMAEELEPQLRREQQQQCLDRLEREHDNLRTALAWSARMRRDLQLLRLGAALHQFWRQRDFWSEARKWYDVMLALDAKPEHEALRPALLAAAASIARWTSRPDSAIQWARAGIESSKRQGAQRRQAEALTVWGEVAWEQKAYAESRRLLEQALALFRQIDDQLGVADVYHWLGHLVLEQGDHAQAQVFFQDSYTRLKNFGDRVSQTLLLNDLGLVAYLQEDYATSRAYSEQDLALCREIENKFGMALTYNRLGDLARCEEDYGRADALYQESLVLFKAVGDNPQTTAVWHNIAHVRLGQGKVADAATLFNQALHAFQAMGDQNGVIDCLAGLAGVAISSGQPAIGARWLSASEKAKQALGTSWWPANHIAYRRHLARAREQLDDEAFNAAWDAGRAQSLEQAIDLAIAKTELPIIRPLLT